MDSSFHDPYYDELFSEVAADIERSVKSKEFNNKLDITIDSFFIHLSPYFLLRPAQKCIEWLLHRYVDIDFFLKKEEISIGRRVITFAQRCFLKAFLCVSRCRKCDICVLLTSQNVLRLVTIVRPGSHDQVFCTICLYKEFWTYHI